MKKIGLVMACILFAGISAAHADQIALNFIDTNDCGRAQNEIRLLNSSQAYVDARCSDYGYFPSDNGTVYNYRLYTTVSVPFSVGPGTVIQLNVIDTNDCSFAVGEVSLLGSQQISVNADCVGPGYYPSDNGEVFNYRVYTSVRVNY